MWDRIVREISADDQSFMSFVGRNSAGTEFDAGELLVTVSPGKLRLAEDRSAEIARIAKNLFGSDVYVTLRGGQINKGAGSRANASVSEEETSRIINEDIGTNDIIEDVEALFGITPTMESE